MTQGKEGSATQKGNGDRRVGFRTGARAEDFWLWCWLTSSLVRPPDSLKYAKAPVVHDDQTLWRPPVLPL